MSTLTVSDLAFSYDKNRPILAGLNFQTSSGRILGLVGANGSGKSTLINILAGLLEPASGTLQLDGLKDAEAWRALKDGSALLPQNVDHWLLGETGAEDLTLGLNMDDQSTRALVEELVNRWGLSDFLEQPVEMLSIGQKKRLSLAAALARQPRAILLDEPLAGLDWPGVKTVLDDLSRLKQVGIITILVTHETGLAASVVDDWLLLKPGGGHLFGPDITAGFEKNGVRPISM